ncbi:MAG TPA: energy transducer TonB [Allosphingosinicella sp.]|jgi:TonB family protein
MDTVARLISTGMALAGTLFQLAVIAGTIPTFRRVICLHCHPGLAHVVPIWRPFIENLGDSEDRLLAERRCPGPQLAGTSFELDHAPLPADFRPFDHEETVLACVRVDAEGSVRSVKLISGSGNGPIDRQLVRTIARQWRFAPHHGVSIRPGWQRVRLSSDFPSPEETFLPL